MSVPHPAMRMVFAVIAAACVAWPASLLAATQSKGESELVTAGQAALREGKCRAAAENYVAAAQISADVQVVKSAVQIALGCEQLGAARTAVARWRKLDKFSGEAAFAATLVAFKLYDLAEARSALAVWRDSGAGGNQDPLDVAELLQKEADATAVYRVFGDVLVNADSTAEVQLAHARLAFAAQNMKVATEAAKRALAIESGIPEAEVMVLRAMSVQGDHAAAIAGARALDASKLQGEDVYLLADLLTAAERAQDARVELERLSAQPATRAGAVRRLIAIAMRDGDMPAAEKLLGVLVSDRNNTTLGLLYFAQLAERRGDDEQAMQSYRLLADTPLAFAARAAAARLMMKHDERKDAMAVLDDYVNANPDATVEVGSLRANLLAEAGDIDAALQGLDALTQKYPGHPDLIYQRATVLETGGRTKAALTELEQALKQRPDDPQVQNALGFTLADHKQQLPRAEQLIRTALAVSPDSAAIQDSLGWVLFQRGQPKAALPVLARAWQNSGDSEIASHYGEVLWRSGDEAQARYVWQQALNGNPEHDHLLVTMKRLTGEDVATP
ncbi:MAG: tetratricopeptide repeat protein [Pseudomonadota bacterium]